MKKRELNKKKGKKKRKESKREYVISLGLFLLALTLASVFTLTSYEGYATSEKISPLTGNSVIEYSKLSYNSLSNKITDINGLTFGFDKGKITINNGRSLNLVIETGSNQYSFNSPSLSNDRLGTGYNFSIEENINDLVVKENLIFNEQTPMKLVHYLKNNQKEAIENITYYYTFDLFEGDDLIVNGSSCDYRGNCYYLGKDRRNRVNFNGEYDFVFDDLISNNFTLSDIKFQDNKLWLGFSINVSLEPGKEIELDPTFTTNTVDTLSITPLSDDKVIVAWEDVTDRDATYAIYYINGTQWGSTVDIYSDIRFNLYANHGISVSAFNSTHFVIGFYVHREGDFLFNTRDIYGANISFARMGVQSWDNASAVSVSTFNSTHFVMAWTNDLADDIEARVYDFKGTVASVLMEPDVDFGAGIVQTISVSTFNSTHFVIGWYDVGAPNTLGMVYQSNGVPASDSFYIDTSSGPYSRTVQVDTLNSTHFAAVRDGVGETDARVQNAVGDFASSNIVVDANNGYTDYTSITALNSTHFVVAWLDELSDQASFAIYDTRATSITGEIDVSSAQYDVSITSEDVATNIQLCNNNFAMAWIDNSSSARWGMFFYNGTVGHTPCNPVAITINSPLNTSYVSSSITFNVTAISSNASISRCFYSLDSGSNVSLTNSAGNFWSATGSAAFGQHSAIFYCNQTGNIWNSASVAFSVDNGNQSCTWWYNTAWGYRKNIIIDKDMVNGTQTNFPLFINITDPSLKLYSQTDGDDIVFTDVGGCNKLDHEIEYWDKTSGWFVAWVRIPSLSSASDTIINMYYGNNLSGNQQNETQVWDSNYLGVWHLSEDPSIAGTNGIKDSTINRNNGTDGGSMNSGDRVLGVGAYSLDFDGSDDIVNIQDSSLWDIDTTENITIEAWIALAGDIPGAYGNVWGDADGPTMYLKKDSAGREKIAWWAGSASTTGDLVWTAGTFYQAAISRTLNTNVKIYRNGRENASLTPTDSNVAPDAVAIGNDASSERFYGKIDEVRVSNTPRSAGWINTTYMNMAFPSSFYSVGGEAPYSCEYIGTGVWNINCTHNCTINSNVDMDGNNITITGYGTVTVSANISNYGNLSIRGANSNSICRVTCISGGCFKG